MSAWVAVEIDCECHQLLLHPLSPGAGVSTQQPMIRTQVTRVGCHGSVIDSLDEATMKTGVRSSLRLLVG